MLSPPLDLLTLSCSAPTTAFPLRALHQSGSGSIKSVVPPPCSIAPSPNAIGVLCSALTTMSSTMFYGPAPPHLRITCPRLLSHLGKLGGGDANPLLGQRLGRWGQVSECAQAPAMERYVRAGTRGPELGRPEHRGVRLMGDHHRLTFWAPGSAKPGLRTTKESLRTTMRITEIRHGEGMELQTCGAC